LKIGSLVNRGALGRGPNQFDWFKLGPRIGAYVALG
jgi:hypothetical protein